MHNVHEDGIWINMDKLAGAICDGTILDVGSTSVGMTEARKLAESIMSHHRNYDRVESMATELQDFLERGTI